MSLSIKTTTSHRVLPTSRFRRGALIASLMAAALFTGLPAAHATSLNLVAVGINRYRYPGMELHFAVSDAKDVAAALRGNRLFARADVNLLTDSQATVKNIMDALSLLERRAHAGSYTVLYLSGHGGRDNDGHFFGNNILDRPTRFP